MGASTGLQVELDLFRGPLHTLLDLVERRELPVTGVSLVAVADQYLALVRETQALDLDLTAEFLHVAARLLLLKSIALLPSQGDDEPLDEDDPDEDLEVRLLAYRRFRDAALALGARYEADLRLFVGAGRPAIPTRATPSAIDPSRLQRAMARVAARQEAAERAREAAPSPLVSFPTILSIVVERLRGRRVASFHELSREAPDAIAAITMFLAVLELVRRRRVQLRQDETFGPIELRMEARD